MTSTHGIILAAIGLAMFAILAVVWVVRRLRARKARFDAAATEWMRLMRARGIPDIVAAINIATASAEGIEAMCEAERRENTLRSSEQPPYASPITGTGSRLVNPLEERVAACELDIAGLAQHIAPLDAIIRDVADTKARLDALESKRGGEARAPAVAGLTEDQWNTPPRLVLRESKRGGEGLRVFGDRSGPVYLLANGVIWGVNSWNVSAWNCSGIARFLMSWADREIPPTDPRYAEVLKSWRNREGA